MAESEETENVDDVGEQSFADPDLIDEAEAEDTPKKKQKPRKKRGGGGGSGNPKRRRPFVESNISTTLAKTDLMEMMNSWDWESGEYECAVYRAQPQSWQGRNCHGYIASFVHAIDEEYIQQHFGGGVYDVKVRGPNHSTGKKKVFLDGGRVKISGVPILSETDKDYLTPDGKGMIMGRPQSGPPSNHQRNNAITEENPRWKPEGSRRGAPESRDMVAMTFDRLSKREEQAAQEARELREQLLRGNNSKDGMSPHALRMIQDSTDRAIDAERRAREEQRKEFDRIQKEQKESRREFEGLLTRLGERSTGIPPEMLQTLSEQHRAEINAINESRIEQINRERDRHEREIASVRSEMQSRIDREQEAARNELQRARDQARQDVDKVREDLMRRIDEQQKEYERLRRQDQEQARIRYEALETQARRDIESVGLRAKSEKESLVSQQQLQVDHLKSLHEGQVSQLNAQHEASVKMQESTFRQQISALTAELERTRLDLQNANQKVNDQGDLVTQAKKMKDIGDSLGNVFGLGAGGLGAPLAPGAMSDADNEPKKDRPAGWMGTLMDFADSRMGEMAFEFFKQAAVGAAGPPPGAFAPPGLPGQYGPPQPQPGYGPSPMYQPQQQPAPYRNPGYGPPGAEANAQFVDDDFEEEEEFEEGGEPQEFETEVQDGVVTTKAPQAKPEAEPAQAAPETPAIGPESGEAASASEASSSEAQRSEAESLTPEQHDRMTAMIQGLENAMTSGTPPEQLAESILKVAPAEQLRPFAKTPINKLADDISDIVPGTMLASYNGRKYLSALQAVLSTKIGV